MIHVISYCAVSKIIHFVKKYCLFNVFFFSNTHWNGPSFPKSTDFSPDCQEPSAQCRTSCPSLSTQGDPEDPASTTVSCMGNAACPMEQTAVAPRPVFGWNVCVPSSHWWTGSCVAAESAATWRVHRTASHRIWWREYHGVGKNQSPEQDGDCPDWRELEWEPLSEWYPTSPCSAVCCCPWGWVCLKGE